MRAILCVLTITLIITSCSSSKKIIYSFESKNVNDSVIINLKKIDQLRNYPGSENKLFALLRQDEGGYIMIINELPQKGESPFKEIVKRTKRYIKINEDLQVPVVFDSDILSLEMRKLNIGEVNFGGYYFKIVKENGEYKVSETGVLF